MTHSRSVLGLRLTGLCSLTLVVMSLVSCARETPASPQLPTSLNIKLSDEPLYIIELMSTDISLKEKSFGHAFLVIKHLGMSTLKEEAYGLYPENEGYSVGGPGLSAEFRRPIPPFSRVNRSLSFSVGEERMNNVMAGVARFAGTNEYNLLSRNCIDLLHVVLEELGVARPRRSAFQTPSAYLAEAMSLQLNGRR